MNRQIRTFLLAMGVVVPVHAANLTDFSPDTTSVKMYLVSKEGIEKYIGNIEVYSNPYGIVFEPLLSSLEPGMHGFHVHEDASCEPNTKDEQHQVVPAGAAGDHFDPTGVDTHGGPWGVGHRGDLPNLYVDEKGAAEYPVLAPKLKWEYLRGRSLVIHAQPDSYNDNRPKGGSGERIACGVFFTEAMDDRTDR